MVAFYVLPPTYFAEPSHHIHHFDLLGKDAPGYNKYVLAAIDQVQSHAPDGGGYFAGVTAVPAESPIGYPVCLFGSPLLVPPRPSSYCSGSSYTAMIEALDMIYPDGSQRLDPERLELLRMQEPDGSRREDGVKAWGWWNMDESGVEYSLVQYLQMGQIVSPRAARPGDFLNIDWRNGLGHSVVFLGWSKTGADGKPAVTYWSSNQKTNGLGDQTSPLSKIKSLIFVRMTHPEHVFDFNPPEIVDTGVKHASTPKNLR